MTTGRLTKLLSQALKFIKISLVLLLVLNLLLDTLENSDGSRVVVDPSGGTDGSLDDRGGRDEVMSEAIVETALNLEQVLGGLEKLNVTLVEGLEGLLCVSAG